MAEHRFKGGFGLRLLTLLLVFLPVLTLLTVVFGRAAALSRNTEQLNRAVDTARTAAEVYKAGGMDEIARYYHGECGQEVAVLYLNKNMEPCEEKDTVWVLTAEETKTQELARCRITIANETDGELYKLETARCQGGDTL